MSAFAAAADAAALRAWTRRGAATVPRARALHTAATVAAANPSMTSPLPPPPLLPAPRAGRMPVFYHDAYTVSLPVGHRFPMERYAVTHAALRAALAAAPALPVDLVTAAPASRDDMVAAHDAAFVDGYMAGTLPEEAHRVIGFPWSPAFAARTALITGGSVAATDAALSAYRRVDAASGAVAGPGGVACNQAGGTHHAFADRGEGFCIVNDIAVLAR